VKQRESETWKIEKDFENYKGERKGDVVWYLRGIQVESRTVLQTQRVGRSWKLAPMLRSLLLGRLRETETIKGEVNVTISSFHPTCLSNTTHFPLLRGFPEGPDLI
jgi:hypothetical protein